LSWIEKIAKQVPEPSSPKQLRSFGLILGCGFCAIASLPLIRGQDPRLWALALGGACVISALAAPAILSYPYWVWMFAGHCLGWVNTRVILSILFYVVFTPVSIVMRVVKRDSMRRTFEPELDTYRVLKDPRPASHLKHQF
jgi:multisubunit Na+/H+ antiporter MnhG subunit